ncbi:MAG TPA: hypothetical protein VF720_05125 [Candidatus Eisenbacteria bacterium]
MMPRRLRRPTSRGKFPGRCPGAFPGLFLGVLLVALLVALTAARAAMALDLYWIESSYGVPKLNRSDLAGTGVTTVMLTPGTLPQGLAVRNNGRPVWAEGAWTNARIMESGYNLSGVVPIVTGQSTLNGVAVDPLNQVTFFTSSNLSLGARIHRKTLNGAATTLMTLPAAANPRGIAVDPAANRIFWADFDQNTINRANLDGTGITTIVNLGSDARPWGISVNATLQRVYWTEYGGGRVMRSGYGGEAVTSILTGLTNPTYLASDATAGFHFWTEGGANTERIRRANLDGTGLLTLPATISTYGGIAVGPGAVTGVPAEPGAVLLTLAPPWPLPAAGAVHLSFTLPSAGFVRLAIFDVLGREVAVPVNESMAAGPHVAIWDGHVDGSPAAVGVYFARMVMNGEARTERVVVAR